MALGQRGRFLGDCIFGPRGVAPGVRVSGGEDTYIRTLCDSTKISLVPSGRIQRRRGIRAEYNDDDDDNDDKYNDAEYSPQPDTTTVCGKKDV